MKELNLATELTEWIGEDPERIALMVKEAPIGKSTLRMAVGGRYIPSPLLERAIRAVMAKHPLKRKAAVAG